jgi:hypothetical protein
MLTCGRNCGKNGFENTSLRDQFSRLFMFEYAKENARTFFLLGRRAKLSAGWPFPNDFARFFIVA